ncbi:hypothetical protein [uncultured Winogradskyella sp.]|uniref:hypothetical protein n=1 Tax=uncultured Winogradskyella sp. TaxID=395353 RepID=UPI00261594FB|nr:hypothetical protein [uncultured Winogradskyella sp.]
MLTLSNLEFNNYLKSLCIEVDDRSIIAQDGVGIVCELNTRTEQVERIEEVAMIDRVEFKLNETQQQQLINYVAQDA